MKPMILNDMVINHYDFEEMDLNNNLPKTFENYYGIISIKIDLNKEFHLVDYFREIYEKTRHHGEPCTFHALFTGFLLYPDLRLFNIKFDDDFNSVKLSLRLHGTKKKC